MALLPYLINACNCGRGQYIDEKYDQCILYFLRRPSIIFKTIGTDSPQAYSLRKIYSPTPPFQCCVPIFILFQAATVSAYSTTTLIGEGAGEGRNCGREPGLSS